MRRELTDWVHRVLERDCRSRLKSRLFLLLVISVVLCGACDREQSPIQVIQAFMAAVETLDVSAAESLVCEAQRARVRASLEPFRDVAEPEAFELSLSELVLQEESNDGEVAMIHVSGQLTLFFLGQQETQEINENHTVVKENGRWLICDP